MLAVEGASFVSLLEPPGWAAAAAKACQNVRPGRCWSDLRRSEMSALLRPYLYDYPEVAKESPGHLYDATEIDEILTLRTLTLTDEEKREARATDARAAPSSIVWKQSRPRCSTACTVPSFSLRQASPRAATVPRGWDPVSGCIGVAGDGQREIQASPWPREAWSAAPGRPRGRAGHVPRKGRLAVVQAVYLDVEDKRYLAVTPQDESGRRPARMVRTVPIFSPEEVEPERRHDGLGCWSPEWATSSSATTGSASRWRAAVGGSTSGERARVQDYGHSRGPSRLPAPGRYDTLILVDAVSRWGASRHRVFVIEPDLGLGTPLNGVPPAMNAHRPGPASLLGLVGTWAVGSNRGARGRSASRANDERYWPQRARSSAR